MKQYQAYTDTDYFFNVNNKPISILFSMQNIKPIPTPILKYQAITDSKNQGKISLGQPIRSLISYKFYLFKNKRSREVDI